MILSYKDCIEKYGSDYLLKKEIANGNIFMKEKGVYSTRRNVSDLEVIMSKYPKAVFTGSSAFYYHSLTDVIPDYFYLATKREDSRIRDPRVKQSFLKDDIYGPGITEIIYNNVVIRTYSLERMLVELMRFRTKIPFDYYKEIILNYRRIADQMDFGIVEDYAYMFKNGEKIMEGIQLEVL
ncbi:type IV toxin-antitoxin system AbiEi family antitoxin domain-containing protein [Pseudobutyrivibrio xylanivorans]|uniref:Transcriptional regulator, AbiEi antitoxin, Type IV TA system n=1 Tax=Pseudobutyrivibrio xylanivorans TaxID=185007 RepID=A0A1G5RUV5_PSEXY|nr:hypothetical protein [Pseudobutyrivibrio xylanivorans]SCZ77500.1 Transcriptional regulator, AbiEi antitoxin, Type IV TA system [Pseudobutyrivibrio xylanivorans]